ncbi:hypothetical protein Rsub_07645 [Raphidocelis subcapitata]|uniref:Uncharacterized protein n=1 Tax=Raphidocelis subcapitata TaxID=307507 RepID=A0A2V0P761_9CHLO|nr:hypothetical protein Rsub_07645 [Raphidocelis subcapitata]|eukprot:GBF94762.1 hypothetical protein Rsub_07645 [Raphidocelis subcapitata]
MTGSPHRKSPFANMFRDRRSSNEDLKDPKDPWSSGAPEASFDDGGEDAVTAEMIWNEDIAGALGYGKGGRTNAAYQWWIPVIASLCCLGSFIAWATLVVRGRDATNRALAAVGVSFPWWADAKALVHATAVLYPIFVALAVAVSVWRAYLARTLDIHRPDVQWMKHSRAWQVACGISTALLWGMTLLLVVSVAGHAVWGCLTRAADLVSVRAIDIVGPVWGSVSRVADSSKALTDRVTGLLGSLPGLAGRRLLEEGAGAAGAGTVGALLAGAAAGAGGGRELQQAGFLGSLGQIAQGIAQGINAAANAIPAAIPGVPSNITIPGLPQLLPNGSTNPLVSAITDVTNAIETQILNPTGCPITCIDLRDQRWWIDPNAGCVCNLDRLASAVPHLRTAWRAVIPSVIALVFMYVGASFLLMHGSAQWSRTRNEAKLMARIPAEAAAAAAADEEAAKAAEFVPPPHAVPNV